MVTRMSRDTNRLVVELGLASRLEFRESQRVASVQTTVRRLTRDRDHDVLGQKTFGHDHSQRHGGALLGELCLDSEEETSEQLMVAFHHLRMPPGCFRFGLDLPAIQTLRNLLGGETQLAVCDKDARGRERGGASPS